MVKLKTILTGILVVIAILGWMFWIGMSITTGAKIGLLEAEVEGLRSAYSSLNASYAKLSDEYSELFKRYGQLSSDYSKLNVSYLTLKGEYSILATNYSMLKDDYEKMVSIIERGEAIAKSATWLSEDKRLQVTTELIQKYLFGTLSGYDINVTVTNISNEPLDVVWIFLFVYVDGRLCEYWSPLGYSHSVENLYIGESYSYTFTYITEDMTSYKVLVIGA